MVAITLSLLLLTIRGQLLTMHELVGLQMGDVARHGGRSRQGGGIFIDFRQDDRVKVGVALSVVCTK